MVLLLVERRRRRRRKKEYLAALLLLLLLLSLLVLLLCFPQPAPDAGVLGTCCTPAGRILSVFCPCNQPCMHPD
jgi:hypothetical protein